MSRIYDSVCHIISSFYSIDKGEKEVYKKSSARIMERYINCVTSVKLKYYRDSEGRPMINFLNTDHMAIYYYYASHVAAHDASCTSLAEKFYALNKALHGVDIFYEVALPEIFLLVHPVGTVLGRAKYSDYFVAYQNCTVGAKDGIYPTIGCKTVMFAGSSVIGNVKVGACSTFGAGSMLIGPAEIAGNSVVLGRYPAHRVVHQSEANEAAASYFDYGNKNLRRLQERATK